MRLKLWKKIIEMQENRLPKILYENERRRGKGATWCRYTERLLTELELEDKWERQKVGVSDDKWGKIVREKIRERNEEKWKR